MKRGAVPVTLCLFATLLASCAPTPGAAQRCLDGEPTACRGADFSSADLSGADLSGADLTGADISNADLSNADLSGSVLQLVHARGVDLSGADLSGADLAVADFSRSDLSDTNLTGADLRETNLYRADLSGADLSGALLLRTNLERGTLVDATAGDAVVSGVSLDGSDLTGSDWTGSVVRAEEMDTTVSARLLGLGALVCGFSSCDGRTRAGEETVVVPEDAVTAVFANVSRAALINFETPNALSRAGAVSMLAAAGVYPETGLGPVTGWEPVATDLPEGLRDAAALYALANTGAGVRWNPATSSANGRLRTLLGSRDVTLWEITRDVPTARSAIVSAATSSSAAALLRAERDGFAERPTAFVPDGSWQPTPPGFARGVEPGWGTLATFHPESGRCVAGEPAADQRAEAERVREITANLTEDQKTAARFWDDERIRTSTPVGHWHNIAVLILAERDDLTLGEKVRVLALLHIGMADTFVRVWAEKYRYQTARPITLLAGTVSGWNSYLGNPPFPAYPSGHAAVSAFASRLLADELGDRPFVDTGAFEAVARLGLNVPERSFAGLEEAGVEAGMSRVWGGIHVPDDFDGGRRLGHCIATLDRPEHGD